MPAPCSLAEQHAQVRSTRLAFLLSGFATAGWAPLVPFAKQHAALDQQQLGLLLLCLGAGSMTAMPLAGALVARLGCRTVLAITSVMICLALPVLATSGSFAVLCAALLAFGAAVGALDCAMNVQAVLVERAAGRAMMSGFHDVFSLGGILGAAAVSASLSAGVGLLHATLGVVAAILIALALALPAALTAGEDRGPAFALPRGAVSFLGLLCFIAFLTEGAMLDWSAVFLIARGTEPARAGLGYALFAGAMTVGRLTGDALVRRIGATPAFALGAFTAALGIASLAQWAAWTSFVLIGLGCANLVPLLYSALAKQTSMPESAAVPALTMLGYAGMLAGPAAIGFVADATSLATALSLVAGLLLAVAASARAV
ncbi:MAG TPA: MFS transporter [Polyangiales bacterium]|nr:MFS transporter [Polyangiales bacterium]